MMNLENMICLFYLCSDISITFKIDLQNTFCMLKKPEKENDKKFLLPDLYASRSSSRFGSELAMTDLSSQNDELNTTSHLKDPNIYIPERPHYYPTPTAEYNPARRPGDIRKAIDHFLAHKPTIPSQTTGHERVDEATGLKVRNAEISIFASPEKLSYYGPVLPMYFTTLKQMIGIIFLLSAVATLIPFYENTYQDLECFSPVESIISSPACYQKYITSLVKNPKAFAMFLCASFAIMVLLGVSFYFFRRKLKMVKRKAKKLAVSPSDYTLICYGMGKDYTIEKAKTFFAERQNPTHILDVCQLTVSCDIEQTVKNIRTLTQLLENRRQAEFTSQEKLKKEYQKRIDYINSYFQKNKANLKDLAAQRKTGVCFVTYNSKQEAKSVRRRYEISAIEKGLIWTIHQLTDEFPDLIFDNRFLKVEKAPEYDEIIWEQLNSNFSTCSIKLVEWIGGLAIFSLTTMLIYYLKVDSSSILEISQNLTPWAVGIVILFSNLILQWGITWTTFKKSLPSITKISIELLKRISMFQVLNSVVPLVIVNIALLNSQSNKILVLSSDIMITFIVICVFPLLTNLISPNYWILKCKRRLVSCSSYIHTQEEINQLYLDPEIKIHEFYIYFIRTVLFVSICFGISPGVAPLGFLFLTFAYWIDKYNILRRHMIPTNLRSEIAEEAFEVLELLILFLGIGLFLLYQLKEYYAPVDRSLHTLVLSTSIFGLVFSGIYILLPNKRIARHCCSSGPKAPTNTFNQPLLYQQAREFFMRDYWMLNPVIPDTDTVPEYRNLFKKTYDQFKEIEILNKCPEFLPLFEYASKSPGKFVIFNEKYKGYKNPYFIYPQNFKYARVITTFDSTVEVIQDHNTESTLRHPLMGTRERSSESDTIRSNSRESVDEVPPLSHYGASIRRDLLLFRNLKHSDSNEHEKTPTGSSIGTFTGTLEGGTTLHKAGSMNNPQSLLEGISPISNKGTLTNNPFESK